MENVIYNADYFIKKFEAIPENKWNEGYTFNPENNTCCAYGHLGVRNYLSNIDNIEAISLSNLLKPLSERKEENYFYGILQWVVTKINDGTHPKYKQENPKQRILAALYNIKKMQQPIPSPKPQKEYIIVHVDKTIPEQARKLTEALN